MIVPLISLWQPWASLCFTDDKLHETRGRNPPAKHVGHRIAIQAALRMARPTEMTDELEMICRMNWGVDWRGLLPRGAIIGTVHLVGVLPTVDAQPNPVDRICGDWAPGRSAWQLELPEIIVPPIPFKGKQGWSSVDIDALRYGIAA